jgi:hypothetical protein
MASPMRVVCHYCGFSSESMIDALRHDAWRPQSCRRWDELMTLTPLSYSPETVDLVLRVLTVQGGGNLDLALDEYREKVESVYR